jgi:serine/threonine-protein kinase
MDPDRWELVQSLFHDALDRPEATRRAFVDDACGDDAALRDEVLTLLAADAGDPFLLDRGLAGAAQEVFAPGTAPAMPMSEFGAYRVRHVLGEGGMGIVYLAERTDLGTVAAVKLLRDAWVSPARRERFTAEQRTLARLQHPGIARLYDAGTLADGTPWIAMEYVAGEPITTWCRRRDASLTERLRVFRDVCDAVLHAHRHLVIHRDLKPSNVLVRDDGSVALLDFGIAKQLESEDRPVDQTRTGVRLMTPAYAAPEQILGEPVGVHTDVYSLGVVLYELLAGCPPFQLDGRSSADVERIVVEQEPVPPSVAARRASASSPVRGIDRSEWSDLDVLALTAMRKEPARRYRTVDALVRDIDHYLRGEPLDARPPGTRYRLTKFARRNRRALAATGLVLAGVTTLVTYYTSRLASARDAALAQAARAERIQRFTLNLFSGGDEAAGPADSLRVVTLLDRGLLDARSLSADPTMQGDLALTLGGIYQKLGKLDRADSLMSVALQWRERVARGPDAEMARVLVARALLRSDQARYAEAESLVTRALAIDRRLYPATHPDVIAATQALGTVLREGGTYDRAIATFESVVLARRQAGSDAAELAESLHDLASSHFYAGHLAAADSLDRAALVVFRRTYGERHPRVADVLMNLGAVADEQGRYLDAERYYGEGLAIVRAWYGEAHPETASDLTMLARTYIREEKLAPADSLLRAALAIREHVYGPSHPQVASTVNELGSLALRRKEYDQAEAAFRRMLAIYEKTYGHEHYLLGIAKSNLGSVYLARRDFASSEQSLREALGIFLRTLGPVHLNTGIAHVKLGRTLLQAGRFTESEPELRAGYRILVEHASPTAVWLRNARMDLATLSDSLHRPADAARFRRELSDTGAPPRR